MALNNPTVGSRGLWELKTPYQSYLPVNTTLECTAITNYGQLFSMGIDPYQTYYQKYNISKEDYTFVPLTDENAIEPIVVRYILFHYII